MYAFGLDERNFPYRSVFSLEPIRKMVVCPGRYSSENTSSQSFSDKSFVSTAECEALVELYESTGGAQWLEQGNWLVTNTPCSD